MALGYSAALLPLQRLETENSISFIVCSIMCLLNSRNEAMRFVSQSPRLLHILYLYMVDLACQLPVFGCTVAPVVSCGS